MCAWEHASVPSFLNKNPRSVGPGSISSSPLNRLCRLRAKWTPWKNLLNNHAQRVLTWQKSHPLQGLTRSHMVSQIWGLKATDTSSSRPSVRTWVPRLTMASPKETSVLTSHEFARHVQTQGSALLNPIKTYWDNQVPHYSCASVLTRGHHLKPKTISKTEIAAGTFLQYLRTMKSLHQNAPNVTAEVVKYLAQLL